MNIASAAATEMKSRNRLLFGECAINSPVSGFARFLRNPLVLIYMRTDDIRRAVIKP